MDSPADILSGATIFLIVSISLSVTLPYSMDGYSTLRPPNLEGWDLSTVKGLRVDPEQDLAQYDGSPPQLFLHFRKQCFCFFGSFSLTDEPIPVGPNLSLKRRDIFFYPSL